ncbi:MAG: uroporphyrinogen decarboxylase [Chitinophagales bacterium]
MSIRNDLLLRAARGAQVERVPVWLMRQAGRILPQYRALRAKVGSFRGLIGDPALACEVTLQPVDELGVDAAIIFSDILVVCEAMNLPYEMVEKRGPFFPKTVKTEKDLAQLRIADGISDISYTIEAIRLTKRALNGKIPLIGFAACPWTLFAYMVEGSGSKTFSKAKKMLYSNPVLSHRLLHMITKSTIAYLKAQIQAGADIIQVFDSWAGILSPKQYDTFGLPYIQQICDAINEVPLTVFAKGAFYARHKLAKLNCETLGLDWTMSPQESRQLIGTNKTLQGNLDPCFLYASKADLKKATRDMLNAFGGQRHIANLGHGVYPDTPLDNVKCFVDTVQSHRF